jgi:hypothetical protein
METETAPNSKESVANLDLFCQPHILPKVTKHIAKDQFSLRTTGAGIHIVTHCMANYKVILSYLSEHNFHHFTPREACQSSNSLSHQHFLAGYIILSLQELGYDISVKRFTTKSR